MKNYENLKTYWHNSHNFGDALAPIIYEYIFGKEPKHIGEHTTSEPYLLLHGSILDADAGNTIIWGAGIANRDEMIYDQIPITINHKVLAVRGEISKQRIIERGGPMAKALGDTAYLMPKFYSPTGTTKHNTTIVPSWVDYEKAKKIYGETANVIDVLRGDPLSIIEEIVLSKQTICSSLHGLIISSAYDIPTTWVKMTDKIMGDGIKYRDFYSVTSRPDTTCIDLREEIISLEILEKTCKHTKYTRNIADLVSCLED